MKKCPQCSRIYDDETLNFCLDDGEWLQKDLAGEESQTALFASADAVRGPITNARSTEADQTAILPESSFPGYAPSRTSAAEYVLNEVRSHKRAFASVLGIVLVAITGFSYWFFKLRATDNSAPIASIAVLPFQNKSDDPDTDYLSDGLAESLIFRLSQLPNLRVSPTTSVTHYKGKELEMAKIANELGVDSIMTGRLVKRGDSLNITVELVDVRNNTSLWGEQYERKMSDLLATQREIASTIAEKLQIKLSGSDRGVTKKYTDSNEAYQLYLKGRFYFAKRTKEDLFKSIETYEQAVKLDPKFALAYVGIAESWTVIPSFPYASPAECVPKAKAAVQKALDLDSELSEAHTVSGMIAATYDWDWIKAESEFKRSLELDPNLAITHYRYAWTFLSPMGRHDEAIAEMRIAMEREPLYLIQGANFAGILMYSRRFSEAVAQAKKTFDLDPNFFVGQSWLCHAYNADGRYDETIALAENTTQTNSAVLPFLFKADLTYAYLKMGRRQEAEAIINKWKQEEKTSYISNYWLAISLAASGEKDAAFDELEKAYKNRDWFLQRIKVDPFMDPLRDDPRFGSLVKRIGLPQ